MQELNPGEKIEPMPELILVIKQLPSGQIQVTGPINNPILCYGLLELAKDVIRQTNQGQVQNTPPGIVPVRNIPRMN